MKPTLAEILDAIKVFQFLFSDSDIEEIHLKKDQTMTILKKNGTETDVNIFTTFRTTSPINDRKTVNNDE
jgi:hypothetical protein